MRKLTDYKKFFLFMLMLTFLSAVAALISPILLDIWMKDQQGIDSGRLAALFCVLIFTLLVEIGLTVFREKFAKYYNIENFKKYMRMYFGMKYDSILEYGPTNLVERIQQVVNNLYSYMTEGVITIWSSILVLIVILIIVAGNSLLIAGIMLCMIPVNYFGYRLLNKELKKRSEVLQRDSAKGFQQIISLVGQTDYLKQCGEYDSLLEQMRPAMELLYGSMADINIVAQSASKALRSLNNIAQTMILALVVYNYLNAEGNTVFMILLVVLFPIYFSNLSVVTSVNLNKQGLNAAMDFVKEMEKQKEEDGEKSIQNIDSVSLDIKELKIKDKILAEKIFGEYKRGDIVWIKGVSGKGKSTLVKLLVKFRECDGIYMNGEKIGMLSNRSVRSRVNYLSQNVPIISGTLRENLFFNKEWSMEAEEKLKEEPMLKGLLKSRTMDSVIEEAGSNLSGGEKQKIALVRMLYDDVDVLILDEVTSNIDRESAEEILEQVLREAKTKIVFIISHDNVVEKYVNKELVVK